MDMVEQYIKRGTLSERHYSHKYEMWFLKYSLWGIFVQIYVSSSKNLGSSKFLVPFINAISMTMNKKNDGKMFEKQRQKDVVESNDHIG